MSCFNILNCIFFKNFICSKKYIGFALNHNFLKKEFGMKRIFLSLFIILSMFRFAVGGIEAFDPSFNGDGYVLTSYGSFNSNNFKSVLVQPDDGKIIAVGYDAVQYRGSIIIARYLPNGLLDTVANGGSGFGDTVDSVQIGYVNANFVYVNSYSYSAVLQPDGKVVIVGYLETQSYDNQKLLVARYTTDGVLDTSSANGNIPFNGSTGYTTLQIPDYYSYGYAVALQSDGKIVVGGSVRQTSDLVSAYCGFLIARYTTDGLLDTSSTDGNIPFNGSTGYRYQMIASGNPTVPYYRCQIYSIGFQSDGKIVCAGYAANGLLVRCNIDGSLDTEFGPLGTGYILSGNNIYKFTSVAIQDDQNIVVGLVVANDFGLARYLSTGYLDTTFGLNQNGIINSRFGANGQCNAVIMEPDQKIIVAGYSQVVNTFYNPTIARYTTEGILDTTFNQNGYIITEFPGTIESQYNSAVLQADGKIVVAGSQFVLSQSTYKGIVARYMEIGLTGTIDTTYGSNGVQDLDSSLSLPAGQAKAINVITTGDQTGNMLVTDSNGTTTTVAMLNATGTDLDANAFGTGVSSITLTGMPQAQAIMVDATGLTFYILGTNGVVKSVTYGSPSVTTFATSLVTTGYAITQQASGRILVAGKNVSNQGVIAAYTPAGVIDRSFNRRAAFNVAPNNIPGYWNINVTNPVTAISVGATSNAQENADQIFFAYDNVDGNAVVANLLVNGTMLNPDFIFGTPIASVSDASQIKMQLDNTGKIVLVANTGGSAGIKAARYTPTGQDDVAAATILADSSGQVLENILTCSDGTTLILGAIPNAIAASAFIKLARLTSDFILDTLNFNSGGTTPGVLSSKVPSSSALMTDFYALDVITAGGILVSGDNNQTASSAHPYLAAVVDTDIVTKVPQNATAYVPAGTLDISLNDCGAIVTDLVQGSANVVYVYQTGNAYEGMMLLGFDTGTNIVVSRIDAMTLAYDINFNPNGDIPGVLQINNLTGLENIMVDLNNNIIINGTSNVGWAQRISANADSDVILFNMPSDITAAHMVYQQKSGRYIVAGSTDSVGTIVAFQDLVVAPETGLAVDVTFNPLSTGSSAAGRWNIADSTTVYSLAINSDDTIYTAYKNTVTDFLTIAKILANGSGFDTDFAETGTVTTAITPDSAAVIRCVVDASQNIIVAASCAIETLLQVARYSSIGVEDFSFTTSAGVGGSAGIVLQALLETENQQTILIGSNTAGGHGQMFTARLSSSGVLDTTWNPNATSPDVPGMLTFGSTDNPLTSAITIMKNAAIDVAGNIFAVGGNRTNPVLMEIVGDSYVNAVAQGQLQAPAGTVDSTLARSGSLNLVTSGLAVSGYIPNKLYIYPNGSMLIGSSNGTVTTITKVDATLALDTTFNHGAILSVGVGTGNLLDMFVDNATGQDGTMYLSGLHSGVLWAAMVSADGLTVTNLATSTATPGWTKGYAIRKAANDNIIVAGFNGTNGAIASFFPNGAALDPYFGNNGVYATSATNPIAAMTIDSLSRIYIAYKTSSAVITIDRLTPAGIIDPLFTPVTLTGTAWSGSAIKMVLDEQNNQLIIAAQDGSSVNNILKVARFSTVDGSNTGTSSSITMSSISLALSDAFVDTNQDMYVVGINKTDSKVVTARLLSTSATSIALDTQYYAVDGGTPGIANVTAGSMLSANAAGLDPDGRVYLIGYNSAGSGTAYMARLFGDNYFTQVSQAASFSSLGQLDYSYGNAGIAINYAAGQTLPAANQQVRTILPLTTGTNILTSIGDGVNAWTVQLLPDGTNNPTYGAGQGIAIGQARSGNELVQGMVFDGSGNTIIFGRNTSLGGYVKSILSSGSMNLGFGGLNSNPAGTMYSSQFDIVNGVAQLSNGNYIIVGSRNNVGKIAMLNPFGIIEPGFIVRSFGTNITSVSVDSLDNIYIAYASTASSIISANVAKLNATGGLVSSYGNNGIVSGVMTSLNSGANIRSVLDLDGKVVVAASGTGDYAGTILVRRLTLSGAIDSAFHSGTQLAIPFDFSTSAVITSLVALQNGNYYVAGYQYDPVNADNNDYEFVAAVTNSGDLDSEFNMAGDVPGVFTFQVATGEQTGRNIWNMSVQDNGQILLAGSEGPVSGGQVPLTMRVNGYPGIKSIPQFTGAVPVVPTDVSSTFGISYTFPAIMNLMDGGSTAVDSLGRVLIGGITTDHRFVVARFLSNGTLDSNFSNTDFNGITETPVLATLRTGSFVSVDSLDNVYISGMTSDHTCMVAKFLGNNGNLDTEGFNSSGDYEVIPGVTQSVAIPTLVNGGYTTVDYLFNVIVGGITSDHKLVVARFTQLGLQDGGFGTNGVAQTGVIPTLQYGGYVATEGTSLALEDLNNIYIGASTYDSTLMVACFNSSGILNSSFGTSGIAATGMITNLSAGGPVVLDSNRNVIIGGFTTDKSFVAAKFLPQGNYDPAFSFDGITFSNQLASLDSCVDIAIDSNDNILLGGASTAYNNISKSMVAARWTPSGAIDTTFTSTGIATTGIVDYLVSGGFIAINALNNVLTGGYAGTRLVIGALNSGAEIFISNPRGLPTAVSAIYLYGNDSARFRAYLGADFFVKVISDINTRNAVLAQINLSLDEYLLVYQNQPNLNLAASTTPGWDGHFSALGLTLAQQYPNSAGQIADFFVAFNQRRLNLHNALAAYSRR
jgi:uncharacterized delta-60 repeat protein